MSHRLKSFQAQAGWIFQPGMGACFVLKNNLHLGCLTIS